MAPGRRRKASKKAGDATGTVSHNKVTGSRSCSSECVSKIYPQVWDDYSESVVALVSRYLLRMRPRGLGPQGSEEEARRYEHL